MAANELIDHLEMWGTFDKAMIKKLRQKVKNTPKEPTAQALLNYLVKKGVISNTESEDLLTKYLNDPGQDSAVLLQEDLLDPQGGLPEADNETAMDFGNFSGKNQDDEDSRSSSDDEEPAYSSKYRKETNWGSVWIWVGTVSLVALSGTAFFLWHFLTSISAEEMYTRGSESYSKSAFADARKKLSDFLEKYPTHDRASAAVVMKTICDIQIPLTNHQHIVALESAEENLKKVTAQAAFNEYTGDLADLLPRIAVKLSDAAKKSLDFAKKRDYKDKAERAMLLVNNTMFIPSKKRESIKKVLDEITESIALVNRQLKVEETKNTSIEEITSLANKGQTEDAYRKYRELVTLYPELEILEDIRNTRKVIAQKEQTLVKTGNSTLKATAGKDANGEVLFVSTLGKKNNISDQLPVPVITDGTLYCLRASSGEPIWRKFLGYQYRYHPVVVRRPNSVQWLVSNSDDHSISLVDCMSGKTQWTVSLGEAFHLPIATESHVIVSTYSGKIHRLDIDSGNGDLVAQLPQTISAPGAFYAKGNYLYQPGDHWFMYVIDTRDMQCKETVLLYHQSGSITHAPVSMRDYLYIAESYDSNSKVHVLNWTSRGKDFTRPQPAFNFPGAIRSGIIGFGREDVLVVDNKGSIDLLSNIGDEGQRPVLKTLSTTYTPVEGLVVQPRIARTGDLYLSGQGLGHYVLSKARGKIDSKPVIEPTATFVDPVELAESSVVHTRRRMGNSIYTVTSADKDSRNKSWTSDLGSPLGSLPFQFQGKNWVINSIGDQFQYTTSGPNSTVVAKRVQQGSVTRQSLQIDSAIVSSKGNGIGCHVGGDSKYLIFSMAGSGGAIKSRVSTWPTSYAPLSCPPVLMEQYGIVASAKGVVGLINLADGQISPGGFRPRIPPKTQLQWRRPAVIDSKRFVIASADGRVFLLEVVDGGLVKKIEVKLDGTKILSPVLASGMSSMIVTRTKGESGAKIDSIQILNAQLKSTAKKPLPTSYVSGPWLEADSVLVQGDRGQIFLSNKVLTKIQAVDSQKFGAIIGTPVFIGGKWFAITNKNFFIQIDTASGTITGSQNLGQPLHNGPVNLDGVWQATTRDGSIVVIPNK